MPWKSSGLTAQKVLPHDSRIWQSRRSVSLKDQPPQYRQHRGDKDRRYLCQEEWQGILSCHVHCNGALSSWRTFWSSFLDRTIRGNLGQDFLLVDRRWSGSNCLGRVFPSRHETRKCFVRIRFVPKNCRFWICDYTKWTGWNWNAPHLSRNRVIYGPWDSYP